MNFDLFEDTPRLTCEEAFDWAEALNVVSLEWGLYAVNTRLQSDPLSFRAGSGRDVYEGLDEAGREIYSRLAPFADETLDPYSVPEWAEVVLIELENAEEAP